MHELTRVPRPKAIATDIDGTLLRSDGSLSARTRAAIAAAEDAGVPTVFVTARPPRWLDELADAVGNHGVAICGNGAFVYDVASKTVTSCRPHADDDLRELVADLQHAIPGITFAVERVDGMGRERTFVNAGEDQDTYRTGAFAEIAGSPVGKLLARVPAMDPEDFLRQVAQLTDGRVELGYSGAVGLAEMTALGVTKASGLASWCEGNGLSADQVWACGDMPNDLTMLAWAGRSFAVRNAHPDVLAAADHVVAGNDDDGVAEILEHVSVNTVDRGDA